MTVFDQHRLYFCDAITGDIAEDADTNLYACIACQAEFKTLSDLRDHRVTHQESSMIM